MGVFHHLLLRLQCVSMRSTRWRQTSPEKGAGRCDLCIFHSAVRMCARFVPPAAAAMALKQEVEQMFASAVAAAQPYAAVSARLKLEDDILTVEHSSGEINRPFLINMRDFERVQIVGFGKATPQMAAACRHIFSQLPNVEVEGHIVTKHGHAEGADLGGGNAEDNITWTEASHPIPCESGVLGTEKIMSMLAGASENTLCVVCVSGGGSALLVHPADGITLDHLQQTNAALLGCGATIQEINTFRKHLSAVKGGQLSRIAQPATVISLILSDVIGDPLDVIASGPTVPDPSTFSDCLRLVEKYRLMDSLPLAVLERLRSGEHQEVEETPKPGDACFEKCQTCLIGNNAMAINAAEACAKELGFETLVLSSSVEGEARDVGQLFASIMREVALFNRPLSASPGCCIIAGGETTVTVRGNGKGGRNQEMALSAAKALHNLGIQKLGVEFAFLAGGTDGTDGPTDAAGGLVDQGTVSRAEAKGLSVDDYLSRNDSYNFFRELGDGLVKTGPTGTNVADVSLMVVRKSSSQGETE